MGLYDLPALFKYIKKESSVGKLTYIAHSQGCAQVLALCSLKKETCEENLNGIVALGPAAFVGNAKSGVVYFFAKARIDKALELLRFTEILSSPESANPFTSWVCKTFKVICNGVLDLIGDDDPQDNNQERIKVWYSHYPSGASLKSFRHFADNLREKRFMDYATQVDYPLENVSVPISIHVGEGDLLADVEDVRILKSKLRPEIVTFYKEYPNMGHMTFFMTKGLDSYIGDVVARVGEYSSSK